MQIKTEELMTAQPLVLRRDQAELAMREARKRPWLCAGLDTSILPAMLCPPPGWIPKQGDRITSREGSYLVLRREAIQPQTAWPWLLCVLDRPHQIGTRHAPTGPFSPLPTFAERSRLYASLLSWRAGRARPCVDESGNPLKLISASELARASLQMSHGPKLAAFRTARASPSRTEPSPSAIFSARSTRDTEHG